VRAETEERVRAETEERVRAETEERVRAETEERVRAETEEKAEVIALRTEINTLKAEIEAFKRAEARAIAEEAGAISKERVIAEEAKERAIAEKESEKTEAINTVLKPNSIEINLNEIHAALILINLYNTTVNDKNTNAVGTKRNIELISSSPTNTNAIDKIYQINTDRLKIANENGEINYNAYNRLKEIQILLKECNSEGIIIIISNESNNCILNFSKLVVKDLLKFNNKIRNMVIQNKNGLWNKTTKILKNPTNGIYELFWKIGLNPRFRGREENDPGKEDKLYYKEWEFKNNESFKDAYKRLSVGFDTIARKEREKNKRLREEEIRD